MGDLRVCSPEPNGSVPLPRSSFPSNPTAIDAHYWLEAEGATQEIIALVQPTLVSEERRRVVIDYVQRLIRRSLGCEVFPFGSVPLKTYLPDGDIDLTAFGGLNVEEALANDVYSILEKEDHNRAAEFVVRDVQLIRAEVKLVKCLVQNIVVDISFNQLGGLCTLCFLEKVDRLIAKDHLFKRSIILIKAWCYYESRILGAHHGLISTYALETLVLYIFHLFHSSLNGPLAVLYKFLDYFSKFDWENYCISLNGPVRVTSLPEIVAETPDNGGGDLLLSNEFLKDCVERFSSTSRGSEANSRIFLQKHLNIVDPLKENNNLGRSVSKGNFYRIRSAFTYGARKLGRILSQSEENLADEIRKFFSNTLDRHGSGQRPDVQDPLPVLRHNGSGPPLSFAGTESWHVNQTSFESESAHSGFIAMDGNLGHEESSWGDINVKDTDMRFSTTANAPQNGSSEVVCTAKLLEADLSGITISENRISGDAQDLATSKVKDPTISNHSSKSSSPSGVNTSSFAKAPHLYFSSSFVGNGEKRKESSDQSQAASSNDMKKVSSGFLRVPTDETDITVSRDLDENHLVSDREVLSPVGKKHSPLSSVPWPSKDLTPTSIVGTPEALNSLSDLNGDFENHIDSLNYGRLWLDCALNTPVHPLMLSQFQRQMSWETVPHTVHAMQSNRNVLPLANANGHVVPGTPYYPMNSLPIIPRAPFPIEEMPKPRGTGTYFPNANHYRDRPLAARGRNPAPVRSPRNNGRVGTHFEPNSPDRSSRELSHTQFQDQQGGGKYGSSDNREPPLAQFHSQQAGGKYGSSDPRELSQALFHAQGAGKYGSSDPYQGSPKKKANPNANNPSSHQPEKTGVLPPIAAQLIPSGPSLSESCKLPYSGGEVTQNPSLSPLTPGIQTLKHVLGAEENRIAVQSYKLKDDEDFPPLSF